MDEKPSYRAWFQSIENPGERHELDEVVRLLGVLHELARLGCVTADAAQIQDRAALVSERAAEQAEQLADRLGVIDNIVFNDFVPDPQRLMQICDCICLTTYEETFGLVLPEAMRAGVAVIGSNAGGVPEIIDHQQTGLLFDSKDDESLYQQLLYYCQDPVRRDEIAQRGKQKADDMFDESRHFKQLESILQETVR